MEPPVAVVGTSYPILPKHGACLVCRKRKLRCDAGKPGCDECIATNRKCQYEDESYKTRIQQLQIRVEELEARIKAAQQGASISSDIPSSASGSSAGHSSHTTESPQTSLGSYQTQPPSSDLTINDSSFSWSVESLFPSAKPMPPVAPDSIWTLPGPKSKGPEPSAEVAKNLLAIFILRQAQCGFGLHMGRVIASLQPGAAVPIIPALLDAMMLLACHFSQEASLKAWEGTFLDRTKNELEENITRAHGGGEGKYNAVHHLQAMCLLAHYYLFKGRLLEGHFHVSGAARFAVTMGFHQLNSRIFQKGVPAKPSRSVMGIQKWQPSDPIELGEAINVWWICSVLDLGSSTLNGLPLSVTPGEIATVWPCLIEDFEDSISLPNDDYSTAALLDPDLSLSDVSQDNFKCLIAKSCILLQTASNLETERVATPHGLDEWWFRFDACDRSVARFMQTMPPVKLARNVEELASLVLVHTVIYCSTVQLHSPLAEIEFAIGAEGDARGIQPDGTLGGLSYTRCTEACRASALAALVIADIDLTYMHMFIGLAWVCVMEVLTREVPRLRRSGHIRQAQEKERQLAVMERSMERLVATYPILRLQVEQVRSLKNW